MGYAQKLWLKHKKKRQAALIEKELPFALMQMSTELNIQLPFEKVLENTAQGDYGFLSGELEKTVKEINESGSSVPEALWHFSQRFESKDLRRSLAQVINAFHQGNQKKPGEAIKRIAEELLVKQKAAAKEFSGKLVMLSLLFIAASAIVPALFQAFAILGSAFLNTNFSPLEIILITCVGFPLLDTGILLLIKSQVPEFLRE